MPDAHVELSLRAWSPLPFDLALLTLFSSTYLTGSWKLPQKGGVLDEVVGGRGGGGLAWFISGLWWTPESC